MKTISSHKSQLLAISRIALLIGAAAAFPAANADEAIMQGVGRIAHVTGGVGDESMEKLRAMRDQFNLKLVFALKSGAYLSDVRTVIADAKGLTLLDTTSEGPWLLTRLPAGTYQVAVSSAGVTKKRQISVPANGMKTVDFRWDSDQ